MCVYVCEGNLHMSLNTRTSLGKRKKILVSFCRMQEICKLLCYSLIEIIGIVRYLSRVHVKKAKCQNISTHASLNDLRYNFGVYMIILLLPYVLISFSSETFTDKKLSKKITEYKKVNLNVSLKLGHTF